MKPRVSVIIPSYNHVEFVASAIESVLNQSYEDFEVLVTDDGSNDGTVDVIQTFSDSRIDFVAFEENRGAAFATNASIRRASGDFVCMLSSDDCFLPGKLALQVAFLDERPEFEALFGQARLIDERGHVIEADVNRPYRPEFLEALADGRMRTRHEWLRHFFLHGNGLCHSTLMIRRRAYDQLGLYDPRLFNLPDLQMWVRVCSRREIALVPDELSEFRLLDSNRNAAAPRPEVLRRIQYETYKVLELYESFSEEAIASIFAEELRDRTDARRVLAEVALDIPDPAHKLFGLNLLYETLGTVGDDARNYSRFIGLTGNTEVLRRGVSMPAELIHSIVPASRYSGVIDECGRFPGQSGLVIECHEPLYVSGWVASIASGETAAQVSIRVADVGVDMTYALVRADVAETFACPQLLRSGFAGVIPGGALPLGKHQLTIEVVARDGSRAIIPGDREISVCSDSQHDTARVSEITVVVDSIGREPGDRSAFVRRGELLHIVGWAAAIAKARKPAAIELIVDQKVFGIVRHGLMRIDVARNVGSASLLDCGFEALLATGDFDVGIHEFAFRVTTGSGEAGIVGDPQRFEVA